MKIRTIKTAYFSPCGGTKRVACELGERIAERLGVPHVTDEFTLPSARAETRSYQSDTLLILALPTYAGRIPNKILPDVKAIFVGSATPVIPLATYGNRSYGDALLELRDLCAAQGFLPFAAAAVVCRHVFSEKIAHNRPDTEDQRGLLLFAEKIAALLDGVEDSLALPSLRFADEHPVGPYYTPLDLNGEPAQFLKAKPVADASLCDGCGICRERCPVGAIDPADPTLTPGVCIKCQACIKTCPRGARHFADPAFLSHVAMLERDYTDRALSHFLIAKKGI